MLGFKFTTEQLDLIKKWGKIYKDLQRNEYGEVSEADAELIYDEAKKSAYESGIKPGSFGEIEFLDSIF